MSKGFASCQVFFLGFNVIFYFNVALCLEEKADTVFVTDEKYRNYRLEDFFWTGKDDGPVLEDSFGNETNEHDQDNAVQNENTWRTTTVFHTTTIVFATLYPQMGNCGSQGCTPQVSPVWTETIDFSSPSPSSPVPEIVPTPTQSFPKTSVPSAPPPASIKPPIEAFTPGLEISEVPTPTNLVPPDQRYWLLTVLRTEEGSELRTHILEERLAKLYQRAFMRNQREDTGQVRVVIHNATGSSSAESSARDVGLVYTVSVSGTPIPAVSAAEDMRLLTLSEVSAELGLPVLTKAERKQPAAYLKGVVPYGARVKGRSRDTWLLIGSVVAAVSLLVVVAALFTLGLSKKRAQRSARSAANKRQIYDGEEGTSNLAFIEDNKSGSKSGRPSEPSATVTFAEQRPDSGSSSSCSGSSEASLVRLRMQQRKNEERRPKPRPRTRVRRVEDSDLRKDGYDNPDLLEGESYRSRETLDCGGVEDIESLNGPSPNKISTPTSYLSMPSVKAFPRKTRIPEPLNRVLEPTSIRHLDYDDGALGEGPIEARNKYVKAVTRHGSLEDDDPGVIGPLVWDRHCQHISALQREHSSGNIGRMRKRFNDLLDDTFNAFGSRSENPEELERRQAIRLSDSRAKSAVVNTKGSAVESNISRPKTTDNRPQTAVVSKTPRGAWQTPSSRTPGRPFSSMASLKSSSSTPIIDSNLILVDSELAPSDPAVPLIAAIKEELQRFKRSDSSSK